MTITISDTEIDITANSASLAENAGNGDEVLTMATTGDDRAADGGFEIDSGNTGTAFAIDAATGVLTVADATAIDYETLATYTLVISVNDGTGDDVTESVTITITDVNDNSPVFSDGDSASASTEENSQTVGTYAATDADDDADLTYSIVASGDNANSVDSDLFTVDQDTGALTFSSAPNYEAPGCGAGNNANSCVVIVQVSDGANTDTITVSVTVTDVNDAPTVSSEISDATIDEDSAYSLVVTSNFADADGDTLTYTASGLPSSGNLAMSSAGTLSGTPLHADIGSYTVVVTATDDGTGTLTVTDTFTLTISNVNDAPSASAGSDQTPTEGDTVTLDASGSSDEDSDSLTYAWSQDSGTTMSLSDTTAASPTFTAPQAVADYTLVFTVTVSDGNGGSDTDSVTITVSADNDAPSITSSAVTSADRR